MLARLRLIPQDDRFFDLFNRSAENTLEGARLLNDLLVNYVDVDRKARHLKDIEHTGDEITHEVFRALNRTFVTPLDREDISHLASALDDVCANLGLKLPGASVVAVQKDLAAWIECGLEELRHIGVLENQWQRPA